MPTKTTAKRTPAPAPRTVSIKGRKFVMVPANEYRRMLRASASAVPTPEAAVPAGSVPALAFADSTIASGLIRDREAVGLTQRELARRAGMRVEVLNRAERGAVVPSVRTLTKIENALVAAGLKRR
ncbi:MAG TPA: helix-turn-helix transcriptional regulator [Tepidisphaeraceae bacterium]|nr:helix-turn-helix transcriptional regulator [Tepidisphaeraceae bacterium]